MYGRGTMSWPIDQFHPLKAIDRRQISLVIADHRCEQCPQARALDDLAPIEGDRLRCVTQSHQRVPERGVELLVAERQPDDRPADPEGDHRCEQDENDAYPEHRPRKLVSDQWDRQRAGEIPQDCCERNHRDHGIDRAEQQSALRAGIRDVGQRTLVGGENVDVELDALVGVVDLVADEAGPVVRLAVKPVPGEAIRQPRPPCQAEPLPQEQVQQQSHDVNGGQYGEDPQRHPESAFARLFDRFITGCDACCHRLEGGEHIAALVGEQHVQSNASDHQQQEPTQPNPYLDAFSAGEVGTGDAPELPAPRGEAPYQNKDDQRDRGRDRPPFGDPDQ